jgi:hypothetical protein
MNHLLFAPIRHHKMVINALCFLVLLKCSRHRDLVDYTALCNSISHGWECLRAFSVAPDDFQSRACSLLERLSKHSEAMMQEKPSAFLPIKSRMGANLTLSTMIRARECAKNAQNEVSLDSDKHITHILNSMDNEDLFDVVNWEELFLDMAAYTTFS